jgi:esterase
MDLNFKDSGQGQPLLVLHGLFGMLDNWQSVAGHLDKDHLVVLIDQRNHGRSPHTDSMSYQEMATDIRDFMENRWMYNAAIMGHSMGGKTAMQLALMYPGMVSRLIVVDISPVRYPAGHEAIFRALLNADLSHAKSRGAVDAQIQTEIGDPRIRQFLMKNLRRTKAGSYEWRINLPVIYRDYEKILGPIECDHPFEGPALFIRGGKSGYVLPEHESRIRAFFPEAEILTIPNAGHWVHADAPAALIQAVREFLGRD